MAAPSVLVASTLAGLNWIPIVWFAVHLRVLVVLNRIQNSEVKQHGQPAQLQSSANNSLVVFAYPRRVLFVGCLKGKLAETMVFSNQNKCVLPKIIHEVEVFCSYPLEFWEYPSPNPPSWAASPYLGPANLRTASVSWAASSAIHMGQAPCGSSVLTRLGLKKGEFSHLWHLWQFKWGKYMGTSEHHD